MPTIPNISRDPMAKVSQSQLYINGSDRNAFVTTPGRNMDEKRMFVSPSPNQGNASQIDNLMPAGGLPVTRAGGVISTGYDGDPQTRRVNGNLPYVGTVAPGLGVYTSGGPRNADPFVAGAPPTPNAGSKARARHWKDNPTGHQPRPGVRNPDVPVNGQQAPMASNQPASDPGVKSRKGY